jgi:hypothetical protein
MQRWEGRESGDGICNERQGGRVRKGRAVIASRAIADGEVRGTAVDTRGLSLAIQSNHKSEICAIINLCNHKSVRIWQPEDKKQIDL